jgi:hypothetical protein
MIKVGGLGEMRRIAALAAAANATPDVLTRYPYGVEGRRPFYLT